MPSRKGARHVLIINKDAIDHRWMSMLPAGLLMAGWLGFSGRYWENIGFVPAIPAPYDTAFVVFMVLILAYSVYGMVARSRAFVQAREDHIRLVNPFMAVKLSYRRVRIAHPSHMEQVFPREKTGRGLRKAISPYYNRTAVVLDLKGYPLHPILLRLLFGPALLHPAREGLVLLVNDWMGLSTEIDSMMGNYKQGRGRLSQEEHVSTNLLKELRKK